MMARVGEWLRRLGYLLNRGRVESALEAEMQAHRAMMGDPARFGNMLALRERSRDVWGWDWPNDRLTEAARRAARSPIPPEWLAAAGLGAVLWAARSSMSKHPLRALNVG